MSREYKFRAWDDEESRIVTSSEIEMEWDRECGCFFVWKEIDEVCKEQRSFKLMQFTGRKDINNVEIYEGDIIVMNDYPFYGNAEVITDSNKQYDELNYVGVVEWDVYIGYFLNLKPVSKRVRGGACGSTLQDYDGMLVIGNIYENPELLEYR